MLSVIFPIGALLLGLSILLVGNGLLAVLLGLRAGEAFGETLTGIVMGGYFVGFIAGSFLVPPMIRAVGYIRTFAAMAALASVVAVLHVTCMDPMVWWLLRVVSGWCVMGIYMVVESWLNQQAPNAQRGRVFGVYMIVTLVALGLGLLLAPLLGNSTTLDPFVFASVLFTLGLIPVAVTPMPQPPSVPAPAIGFHRLLAVSPTGFLGAFIAGVVNGILWGLGPTFWRGLGLSEGEAAVFMALIIGGGALLQWPIGHLSDGRDRRLVLGAVCIAAAAAVMLTLEAVKMSKTLLAICAFSYGGLIFAVYSLSVSHVNDHVAPMEILESTRTLLLLYGIGAALGPMVAGPFLEYFGSPALPVISASVLTLLAGVAVQRMLTRARVHAEDQVVFVPLARTSQVAVDMLPAATAAPIGQEQENHS